MPCSCLFRYRMYGFRCSEIYDEMVRLCEGIDGVEIEMQKDIPHVGVIKTGCQGLCELGPLVRS